MTQFNGWIVVLGPGGNRGLASRLLATSLNCAYIEYSDWTCRKCREIVDANCKVHRCGEPFDLTLRNDPTLKAAIYVDDTNRQPTLVASDIISLKALKTRVFALVSNPEHLLQLSLCTDGTFCYSSDAIIKTFGNGYEQLLAMRNINFSFVPRPLPQTLPGSVLAKLQNKLIVGWHGVWERHKGVINLLRAISQLRNVGLDIGLIVQGAIVDEQFFNNCIDEATALNIGDNCVFIGDSPLSDVMATLSQCHMFCLPDIGRDEFGRSASATTCLAFGKPVIVTKCAYNSDALKCSVPLSDITPFGIAKCITDVSSGALAPPANWQQIVSIIHQPHAINMRYLNQIRNWLSNQN